ncbi:MAG: hypothetical protein ACPG4F_13025, partial [Paracoccaceae bacterium]
MQRTVPSRLNTLHEVFCYWLMNSIAAVGIHGIERTFLAWRIRGNGLGFTLIELFSDISKPLFMVYM